MKTVRYNQIVNAVKRLTIESNLCLGQDIVTSIQHCLKTESSSTARYFLKQILENVRIAKTEKVPLCQDTGLITVFIEVGQEVQIVDGELYKAVNEGVRQGVKEGFLRASIVKDPFLRNNSGDNTPAIVHVEIVPGNKIKLMVMPKGAGSENMSNIRMFNPGTGIENIRNFVLDTVQKAGANPCPPIIVGIGIGGNFEYCSLLAKKSLLRKIGSRNKNLFYDKLEKNWLNEINKLKIGVQGLGGKTTALAVFIESYPCHIASLPVAINIQCYVSRHKTVIL